MKQHCYSVYILASGRCGTLYIGMTGALEKRIVEHKLKSLDGFTRQYDVTKLVYYEDFQYVDDAIKREKQMKEWQRQWKINLIEKHNPEWKDLAADWFDYDNSQLEQFMQSEIL